MGSTVAKPLEMAKVVVDFGQFKSGLNSITGSGMHGGEGGIGVDLFVGINHLVVSSVESIQVGSDSPVVKFSCVVLDEGIGGVMHGLCVIVITDTLVITELRST